MPRIRTSGALIVVGVSLIGCAKADEPVTSAPPLVVDRQVEGARVRAWARSEPTEDRFCFDSLIDGASIPAPVVDATVSEIEAGTSQSCVDFESRSDEPFSAYVGPPFEDQLSTWVIVADERVTELTLLTSDAEGTLADEIADQTYFAVLPPGEVNAIRLVINDDGVEREVTCRVDEADAPAIRRRSCSETD